MGFDIITRRNGGVFLRRKRTHKWQCLESMTCVMAYFSQCGSSVIQVQSYFGQNVCQKYVQFFGLDRTHLLQTSMRRHLERTMLAGLQRNISRIVYFRDISGICSEETSY